MIISAHHSDVEVHTCIPVPQYVTAHCTISVWRWVDIATLLCQLQAQFGLCILNIRYFFLKSECPTGLESGRGAVSNPVWHLLSKAFNCCWLDEEACCYANHNCLPTLHTQRKCTSVPQQDDIYTAVYVQTFVPFQTEQGRAGQGREGLLPHNRCDTPMRACLSKAELQLPHTHRCRHACTHAQTKPTTRKLFTTTTQQQYTTAH